MTDQNDDIKIEDIPRIMKAFSEELSKSQFVQDTKVLSQALSDWGGVRRGPKS